MISSSESLLDTVAVSKQIIIVVIAIALPMSLRDYSYYKAHAANVSVDEIISPNKPEEDIIFSKRTLQRLREDNLDKITVSKVPVGRRYGGDSYFAFSEGDDLGWLGYFIGRSESLRELTIHNWSEDVIHALSDGIARNRSIQNISVSIWDDAVYKHSNDGFIARTFSNLKQLEELSVTNNVYVRNPLNPHPGNSINPLNDCVALGNLLESGVRLKHLSLRGYNIGDAGVTLLVRGLRSIGSSLKELNLYDCSIGSEGLSTLAVALDNCTTIKKLYVGDNDFSTASAGLTALSDSLQRTGIQLDELGFGGCRINDEGLHALIEGESHDHLSALQLLDLDGNNFGNEGLSTLAAALADCTGIRTLHLSDNDFSMAAAGLRSLSVSLQTARIQLDELRLLDCHISDEGLQALTEGAAVNHCKYLDLKWNDQITAAGFRLLSTSLQSQSCCLEELSLGRMSIGDDTAELFARALVGNEKLRILHLIGEEEDESITAAGWSALSKVLCDPSSVNATYSSNHTIEELWEQPDPEDYSCDILSAYEDTVGKDLYLYQELNRIHPQHATTCKILMSHKHLDMEPFLNGDLNLKCLPLVIAWYERANPCLTLSVRNRRVLEESAEVFQSRVLTALYQFVRGEPGKVLERRQELTLVTAYDKKIAMVEQENVRLLDDVEERDIKIAQLEQTSAQLEQTIAQLEQRLREISHLARG